MKTDHVQIRIDSPTKDIWKAAAARNRLTLSAYIERAVDSVAGGPAFLRPDEIDALDQVREQLRRTGINLNQLVRHLGAFIGDPRKPPPDMGQVEAIKAELETELAAIRKLLGTRI